MNDNPQSLALHGRVEVRDGSVIHLPDAAITRIVYALTTLSLTPVIDHVNITSVFDSQGAQLWPGQPIQ